MTLIEAYERRLKSFDAGELEEFYNPSQPRDKEGQWTKMWSGVSAHPDHRGVPKAKDITKQRLVQSPEHIARQVYDADLGNGFTSSVDHEDIESYGAGGFVDTYINGSINRADGLKVGYWKRHFYTDDDGALVAEHQELFLDPQYQGRGIADRFNAHSIAKYQKYGVDRIELEAAADVGGYAWARQGFRLKDDVVNGVANDEYRRNFLNRQLDRTAVKFNIPILNEHRKRLNAEVAVLRKAIEAGEDVQPIHLASIGEKYARYTGRDIQGNSGGSPREYETWPGKELLLGTQWNGVYYFDTNAAVTAAASSLAHAELRPAFRAETPVLIRYVEDVAHFHDDEEFACHSAACRPPTSGGTGGSSPIKNPIAVPFHSGVSKDQYKAAGEMKHLGSLRVAANMTDSERETIQRELDHEVVDQEAWATEPFAQAVYMARANVGTVTGMTVGVAVQLQAVYDRYEDDYPVMDKVQEHMSKFEEDGDKQALVEAITATTGVSVESGLVNYINSRWAESSVTMESFAMQLTVASIHELKRAQKSLEIYRKSPAPNSDYVIANNIIKKGGGSLRAVANATYRTTQEALEDQGITNVELFRGIKSKAPVQADKIVAQPNPLSSWTTDRNTAFIFSGNGGAYSARIPASQIYSLSNLSGTGALKESEVIVLGQRITAARLNSNEELAATELPVVLIDHDDPDWIKTPNAVRNRAVTAALTRMAEEA